MNKKPATAYGEGRTRKNVSYGDVERAAIVILKTGRRPTVETIREALGGGSPDTIADALKRFWQNLGARIDGDPAALSRMPPDIADLADGMWQRALKLAGEAAVHDDNAARERLEQIQLENEIKKHSFDLREKEMDTQARERERALADSRDHLLLLSKKLARDQALLSVCDTRIADLETQVEQYRRQLATLIASAVAKHRSRRKPKAEPMDTVGAPRRRAAVTSTGRPSKAAKTTTKSGQRAAPRARHKKRAKKSPTRRIR
ncbi:MAG: DNA-binding protein [Acidobacteriota bacterium]|nr:DNA-binding protein [Acidobacteriota bacterium]